MAGESFDLKRERWDHDRAMRADDVLLITHLGKALYAQPELAHMRSAETVAAVSTLSRLNEEQSFEKALKILLDRAVREGTNATASGISKPFFRLSAEERAVLALLHSGKISYTRLAKVLNLDKEDLEKLAWNSRIKVGSSPEISKIAPVPPGTSKSKPSCPEYYPDRPWTQKLLDDELSTQELLFIQNHTMVCDTCRRSLELARKFYYEVEKQIPFWNPLDAELIRANLRRASIRSGRPPSDLTVKEALSVFFEKTEIRIALGVFLIGLVLSYIL